MLLANRMASNFSSCEVASVERRELNSTVLARRGFEDAALDRNLLPYLLGFLEGIATLSPGRACEIGSVKARAQCRTSNAHLGNLRTAGQEIGNEQVADGTRSGSETNGASRRVQQWPAICSNQINFGPDAFA